MRSRHVAATSSKSTAAHPPQRRSSSSFLERMDSLDKSLSMPFFLARLPRSVEYGLSVPGNSFGVPLFALVVAPNLTALFFIILLEESGSDDSDQSIPPHWWGLLMAVCFFFLTCWARVLQGHSGVTRWFFGPSSFFMAPYVGAALLWQLGEAHLAVQQLAFFQQAAWCIGVIPVAFLKPAVARMRPVLWCHHHSSGVGDFACEEEEHDTDNNDTREEVDFVATASAQKAALERKHLGVLPQLFHRDGMSSFPSGDAAGAMAISYPLLRCGGMPGLLATIGCVIACAFGRMFWQAHHLGDVVVGAVVALASCWLWEQVAVALYQREPENNGGLPVLPAGSADQECLARAQWFHPFVAQVLLGSIVIMTRLASKAEVFKGTIQVKKND